MRTQRRKILLKKLPLVSIIYWESADMDVKGRIAILSTPSYALSSLIRGLMAVPPKNVIIFIPKCVGLVSSATGQIVDTLTLRKEKFIRTLTSLKSKRRNPSLSLRKQRRELPIDRVNEIYVESYWDFY